MVKRIYTLILPLLLFVAVSAQPAYDTASLKADPTETNVMVGEQIEAIPQDAPSEEVNYVEESELARKMKQAQKAEDAKKYDSYGGGITIIAMCIVVGALIVLSILFYFFGKISSWFLTHKKKQTSKALKTDGTQKVVDHAPDTGDVIAAISAALAQHFATDHDMQNTILTIRRMRKAYSPWNSKIYNMRHNPELNQNHPKMGDR